MPMPHELDLLDAVVLTKDVPKTRPQNLFGETPAACDFVDLAQ